MMATHSRIESKHSRFDDDRTVHPWNKLVDKLCNTIEPEHIERMMYLVKPQLEKKYELIKSDYRQFFNVLEDQCKEDTVDVVQNLFRSIEIHDEYGESLTRLIDDYKWAKSKYDAQNRQIKNENFVGRESLLTEIIHHFESENRLKGVILWGMSGVGKTAVSNEICCRLKSQKPSWRIIRISEAEKTDIKDLYQDVISGLVHGFLPDSRLVIEDVVPALKLQLKTVFRDVMAENTQRTLIYMDNVDGHCLDQHQLRQFREFMEHILRCLHFTESDMKIRLLITSQKSLSGNVEPLQEEMSCFGGQLIQRKVQPLSNSDAAVLLRKISNRSEMDLADETCSRINEAVGGNAMFLKHVAMNLPFTSIEWMSADDLLAKLFSPMNELSTQLNLCLEKSICMLDSQHDKQTAEVRQVLINLSLFKSGWFSFEDAVNVGIEPNISDRYVKQPALESRMILSLLTLKTHHLMEIDKLSQGCYEQPALEWFKEYFYSLHPLVYHYVQSRYANQSERELMEQSKGEMDKRQGDNSNATNMAKREMHTLTRLQQARLRFLRHFCRQIDRCGKQYGVKPHTAQALLERNKVHIKHFYEYFLNGSESLMMNIAKFKEGSSDFIDCSSLTRKFKNLWKVADLVISAETKINFARRLTSEAESEHQQYPYVFWKCKEVEFLLAAGKTILAVDTFTDLSNTFQIVHCEDFGDIEQLLCRTELPWKLDDEERKPMLAVFSETKGRILMEEKRDNLQVLRWLRCAEKNFKEISKSEKMYKDDRARVINLIGHFYFRNEELEKSKRWHEIAFNIVQGMKDNHIYEDLERVVCNHLNSSEYLMNIAACEHKLADQTADKDRKEELWQKALRKYTICIDYDKEIKKDVMHAHAVALMNRGEIYNRLKVMDLALKDAAKALHIFKNCYSMPNVQKTLAYSLNGYFLYKFGKALDPEERKATLCKAVCMYDDALSEITHGGLPLEHKEFKDIKDYHIKAMQAAGMTEKDIAQRNMRYADFVLGKYDGRINSLKRSQPCRSVDTILQELQAKGAVGVIITNPDTTPNEEVEDNKSDSSKAGSNVTSDEQSDSSSSGEDASQMELDEMIEQTLSRKRRDSGVESDEELDLLGDVVEGHKGQTKNIYTSEMEAEVQDDIGGEKTTIISETGNDIRGKRREGSVKRILQRQEFVDLDLDAVNPSDLERSSAFGHDDQVPGTSQSSYEQEGVEMEPKRRRMSSADTGIGEDKRSSSSTNRSSLSSIGSQDSVTSLLGKRLTLHSKFSLQEEDVEVAPTSTTNTPV